MPAAFSRVRKASEVPPPLEGWKAPWVGKLNYQPVSLSIAGPLLIAAITPLAALLAAFALALGSGERLEKRMSRPAPSLSIEPGR